ncbi:ABC transporter permease [Cohnella lubricantis]|uniref:ABC transporter permease n=1 Tax=Cohnella lubricantis TaxID=2163172 RepID=A0A841TD29_9BACL|nr:ABC transporter permease [Cohnella lubricantis]MBB6678932.1 ABC transporter permease [Cohnella lubricantis]MBP2118850.1 iron complex transport system permease protein [Cohnella lubricantis]
MRRWHLTAALLALSLISLFVGVQRISPADLFRLDSEAWQTFWISRLPRLISIVIAGASMSVCGLIMQQLTRNKFVSPTTAGTMDSAKVGILVAMLLFTTSAPLVKMAVAFVFAFAGTLLFMQILNRIRFKDAIFVPLVGIMVGNVISSIATFIAYKYDLVQNISSWLQGDFSGVLMGRYELMYISVPMMAAAYLYANKFTLAGMGEEFSVNLGLSYKRVVYLGLAIVALSSSAIILTVGTIPFLGLIIPNIVSLYLGDHLKRTLPHTALLGAVFVLACDILGRIVIYPYEIPVNLTVGVIGSVVFLYLLMRRRAYGE